MTHNWPQNYRKEYMKALKDYGFGGVVTNVKQQNGFTSNPKNITEFKEIISELKDNNLNFWLYDENGYPSGYAGGETLKGHPELEAKGFYMRKIITYEHRHVIIRLDDESDKIVYAAKYPLDPKIRMDDGFILPEKSTPVHFSPQLVECDLEPKSVLYAFIVKPAYEGSHATHNVCSYSRYINVMNPAAVRRFIDLCFEPIAKAIPDAYEKAFAVFTDEPSLMTSYGRSYEKWAYALAPWEDSLFEAFEAEYNFSLLPYLPYIFETISPLAYAIRVKFYKLVGKMIAKAYSGQLAEWCKAHGGKFSGHYICEETMCAHVAFYGDFMEVVKKASYPGIDVLNCFPEGFMYNTVKHVQMVVRKNNTNGMMVEICPFGGMEEFNKAPIDNMTGVMNLLYMGGVRVTQSYFSADYSSYDPEKFGGYKGYLNQKQANTFNEYVGRLGYVLDETPNVCNIFVYYGVEDAQAKFEPSYTAPNGRENEADSSTIPLTNKIYEAGYDFYYIDKDDITEAVKTSQKGVATISGNEVKVIIIPKLDIMYNEALNGLVKLKQNGVKVLFLDRLPTYGTELETNINDYIKVFNAVSTDEIMNSLADLDSPFSLKCDGQKIMKAFYRKNGKDLYFIYNNERRDNKVIVKHKNFTEATLLNPLNGDITTVKMNEKLEIAALRGVFLYFNK